MRTADFADTRGFKEYGQRPSTKHKPIVHSRCDVNIRAYPRNPRFFSFVSIFGRPWLPSIRLRLEAALRLSDISWLLIESLCRGGVQRPGAGFDANVPVAQRQFAERPRL